MAIVTKEGVLHEKSGYVEYKMTEQCAHELLKAAKIKDGPLTKRGQEYLCQVVNDNYGIKGECTKVIFF